MKLKTLLFAGCLLLVSGLAHAQFTAIIYYANCDVPLSMECAGGDAIPNGTTVEIYWDQNNNGPDDVDDLAPIGGGFGQANFNTFPMDDALIGCPGTFATETAFSITTNTPQPSRYWLRVCVPGQSRQWRSTSFTIADGLNEYDLSSSFSCFEEACGGCLTPPGVSGVAASNNSCTSVTVTWNAYPAEPDVNTLRVMRDGVRIATIPRTQTSYVDNAGPYGNPIYGLIAARDCGPGDTAVSAAANAVGTRIQPPISVADTSFTAFVHPTQCGAVIVQWRVPLSLATIDSFCVFQNGIEVGRTGPGLPNTPARDTVFTALSGAQNYTIAGWSVECGHGAQTIARSVTAAQPPAQVTGLTASTGLCTVNLAWTAVPGATSYIVRRNGSQIGTPNTNSFSDATATVNVVFSYTVSAVNTSFPAACQEGAQSTSANGSRIGTPTPPTTVVASDSAFCTHVAISWTDNSADETGFVVRRDGVNIFTTIAGATSFNDSAATAGNHNYDVAATNTCGTSSFATVNVGSKKAVPTTPTGLLATDNLPTHVRVTWNAIIRETNMRVLRNGSLLATIPADSLGYNDLTAVAGQVYAYSVLGFNECGDGVVSNIDSGRVLATLNAPTNVAATDSLCDRVTVTWTDNNSAPQETGHSILRDGIIVGNTGPNITTFDDITGVQGVVYSYNVQAEGTGGPAVSATPNNGGRYPLPGVPALVLDSVTCTQAVFHWTAGTNSDTVLIYQDGVLMFTIPVSPNGNSSLALNDDSPSSFYAISANECGRGDTSNVLTVQRDPLPSGILNLAGTSTDCNTIQVTWTAPGDAESFDVYMDGVFLSNVATFVTQPLALVTGNGPFSHEVYFVSRNECGAGDTSNVINVDVLQAPTMPTNVAASDTSCGLVYVMWTASSGVVDGYTILEDGNVVGTTGPGETTFSYDPGDSDSHQYTVFAFSTSCGVSPSAGPDAGQKVAQPGVPTNLTFANNSCDSIRVSWDAASGSPASYVIFENGDSIASTTDLHYEYVPAGGPGTYDISVASYSTFCGTGTQTAQVAIVLFAQPEPVTNLEASNNRCDGIELTWDSYTGVDDGFLVYRNGVLITTTAADAVSYFDAGAVLGTNHYAVITLSNLTGCVESDSATANGAMLPLPTAPQNVSASDLSCSNVVVTWDASSGTYIGYTIYRDTDSIGFVGLSTLEFTDTGILPGSTASYTVAAFDPVCGYSPLSNSDNGTRLLGPAAPTGVVASDNSCDQIDISWDAAPGDVTEYRVYRDGVFVSSVPSGTTSYTDTPASGTYAYTVTAFSTNCGETAPSVADNGTRLPQMGQVVAISASVDSCEGILVTWEQMAGAVNYRVFKDAVFLAQVNAPTGEYMDFTVAEGVQHSYTVAAVNTCNEGTVSNAVVGSRASTPTQVTGLTATTNLISQVCLSWTDVAGELSYNIYRDAVLIATNGADDVDYCDITATPGTTYTYTVAAANVCGDGTISDGAQGSAVFSLGQVTGLGATTTDCAQICLTWTDINNETGYEILRNGASLATVAADVVTYCDLTAAPGECFTYTVRGFNVGGDGPLSAEVQGCRRNIPTQVTGLTATNTNCDAVVLNWNDATDEDRYDVHRDGALLVQNVGALTYTDNSAVAGVVYSYTILAVNACGNAPQSVAVNGVRATTPPQVTGVIASNDDCGMIGLSWTDQLSELGYRVYRDGDFLTPIATVPANSPFYLDANITGTHTYNVRAFNDCGNGDLSAEVSGVGLTTPGVATGVSASNNCGDVTVTWTAPTTSPISEYHVLRNGTQVGVVLVGTTTFVDNNVPAGSFTYRVITNNVCGDGAQSAQSNSVTVIPALVQVPSFTATASSCFCIDVTWGNVANEDGYYLYCDGVIVDTLGANVTSTNYCPADTQTCVVQVAAFNACEIGPLSVGNSVTPNTYPAAVTGFSASENICDRVRLTWNVYNQPGVTRLKIRRDGVAIATLISGNTSFEQLGVWPQSVYSITALRVCAAGDTIEAPLATDNGRTAPTPVAPSQMAASDDGCGIVTVTFTFANVDGQDSVMVKRNGVVIARLAGGVANVQRSYVDTTPLPATATYEVCPVSNLCGQGACASDLGQAAPTAGLVTDVTATTDRCTSILIEWTGTQFALNYQVRRNGTLITTVPQGQFSYTDNVATGTVNTYTVTATNACGSGPQSQPAQGSTIPLPPVPTGVSASDGLCNQVIVTWNEIGVATGYEVWRNNAFLADVPGGVEVYTDLAVTPGTNYNYQVRGVNQCGDGNLSAATTGFSAQVITTVTNVVATTNLNDRVRITWNNVPQETGYQILRGFPAEVIATVGIDVTSYNDFSAAPGEEYEYRVRAFNGCGEGEMSVVTYGYRVPVDPIPFGVITVTEELFGCMSAEIFDGDDDGDPDVIAAGMFADQIVAYENNGSWGYIPHVIVDNWDGARSVAVGDIDDDGDDDAAAVAQFADQLIWIQGNGTLNPVVRTIASNYDGARDVIIADLDGDNDKDLVTCACDANDISWWRNNGSETFTRVVIDNNFIGARSIEVADIGNDGDLDILAAGYEGGMLAWYSNNGSEVFTRNVIMQDVYGASYINAARLNTDNVLDIYFCVAQQPMIGWIDGATQAFHEVTTLVPFPREMDAVDMDQDNRADLLLAANENQEISWWRNTDNRFYRNPITTTLTQASVVHGGDFDNDGDNDVLGAGEGTIKIWLSALSDDTHESELTMPQDDGTDQPTYSQSIVPLNYELSSNYPNPFNPMTQIRFGLPEAQNVKLTVYDVTGREVARLVDGSFGAGYHTVTFDATNLASGLYLYRIEAGDFVSSRKMILMK